MGEVTEKTEPDSLLRMPGRMRNKLIICNSRGSDWI